MGLVLSRSILVKYDYRLCCVISMLALYLQRYDASLNKYDVLCLCYGNVLYVLSETRDRIIHRYRIFVPRFCCGSVHEGCLFRTCSFLYQGRRYCFRPLMCIFTKVYTSLMASALRAAAEFYGLIYTQSNLELALPALIIAYFSNCFSTISVTIGK